MDLSVRKGMAAFITIAPVVTFLAGAGSGVPIETTFARSCLAFVVATALALPIGILVDKLWDR